MRRHDHPPDRKSGQRRGDWVASHRQELTAEHGLPEKDRERDCEHDRDNRNFWKRPDPRLAEGRDRAGDVIEGRRVRDAEVDAGEHV